MYDNSTSVDTSQGRHSSVEQATDGPDEQCGDEEESCEISHSPEYLQRKLYFLLEHLKEMHSELPE